MNLGDAFYTQCGFARQQQLSEKRTDTQFVNAYM